MVRLLALEGLETDAYHYCAAMLKTGRGLRAAPVKVRHVDNMECYGYLLSDGEETIYYSGDACEIPQGVKEMFFAGKIDRLYQDTSTHDSPNPSHCYYEKLEAEIPPEWRDKVYCMHLDSPCGEMLKEKGFGLWRRRRSLRDSDRFGSVVIWQIFINCLGIRKWFLIWSFCCGFSWGDLWARSSGTSARAGIRAPACARMRL